MNLENINTLYEKGIFSSLDIHFGRFISNCGDAPNPEVFLAAALVSNAKKNGHICIDLSDVAGKKLVKSEGKDAVTCPTLDAWLVKLKLSPAIGSPGDYTPLILDDKKRLYLYRYLDYQEKLVDYILLRTGYNPVDVDVTKVKTCLERFFPSNQLSNGQLSNGQLSNDIDWQKTAALASALNPFCVISGGPGTGKTTTIARIMALLIEVHFPSTLRICLAAPTGKAAGRLQESIKMEKEKLDCAGKIKDSIPEEVSTIHRLLKSIPDSPYFRFNENNPLPADVVIIDEASMIDLALMSKLVQALLPHTRLILIGDKNQLSSVEAGSVLGDICDTGNLHGFSLPFCRTAEKITGQRHDCNQNKQSGIFDSIVHLQKSYRFSDDSGINVLSRTINSGDANKSVSLIQNGKFGDIKWQNLPVPHDIIQLLKDIVVNSFDVYLHAKTPDEMFNAFNRFRILCALREGPYGVVSLNRAIEQILADKGLIHPGTIWYPGRPVMITRNDYNLKLFNGDIGIVMPEVSSGNDLRVCFQSPDNVIRKFHPFRLPEHETVYAMTVHKSQGSEFEKIVLILPDSESPVLTRELLYTGITRARKKVEIWGTENIFRFAVSRRIKRSSGLRDALWCG